MHSPYVLSSCNGIDDTTCCSCYALHRNERRRSRIFSVCSFAFYCVQIEQHNEPAARRSMDSVFCFLFFACKQTLMTPARPPQLAEQINMCEEKCVEFHARAKGNHQQSLPIHMYQHMCASVPMSSHAKVITLSSNDEKCQALFFPLSATCHQRISSIKSIAGCHRKYVIIIMIFRMDAYPRQTLMARN